MTCTQCKVRLFDGSGAIELCPKHQASEAMLEALRHFVKHGPPRSEYGHPLEDWACLECKPHSHMPVEGFQCCYHAALSIIASLDSAAEGAEGKAEQ